MDSQIQGRVTVTQIVADTREGHSYRDRVADRVRVAVTGIEPQIQGRVAVAKIEPQNLHPADTGEGHSYKDRSADTGHSGLMVGVWVKIDLNNRLI